MKVKSIVSSFFTKLTTPKTQRPQFRLSKNVLGLLIVLGAVTGCDESTDTIGNSITPGADSLNIQTEIYSVKTRTLLVDSILGRTATSYLGRFTDPETNTIFEADFLAQFNCVEGEAVFPPKDSIQGDSAVKTEIRLYFSKFFGDSTNTMKVEVYKLDNTLLENTSYYTNVDPELFYNSSLDPIASKTFSAIDYTLDDDVLADEDHYANVNIPLPNEIGSSMISQFRSHPEYYANATSFIQNVCKGYYFKCTQGDGTVIYVDQVHLNVYFNYLPTDSIYVTQFSGSQEVLQINHFNNQGLQSLVDDESCTYIKTPAGLFTEAEFPINEIMEKGDTLNSAKLIFTKYNQNDLYKRYAFGTPATLLMVRKSEMYDFFSKDQLTDNVSSFYTSYTSQYNQYIFSNISQLLVHCYEEEQTWLKKNPDKTEADWAAQNPDWNKVVLIPVTTVTTTVNSNNSIVNFRHDLSLNSIRLVGGTDELNLKVITSSFHK